MSKLSPLGHGGADLASLAVPLSTQMALYRAVFFFAEHKTDSQNVLLAQHQLHRAGPVSLPFFIFHPDYDGAGPSW